MSADPLPSSARRRSLLIRLPLLIAAVVVALTISRHWPVDQELHVVLGDAAPRVLELRVRYASPTGEREDWQREATFFYGPGQAPRVVNHAPKLASGDYDVEIEVGAGTGPSTRSSVTVTRHLQLQGRPVSVDVSAAVREALQRAAPPD
jgi:hypothetical protein